MVTETGHRLFAEELGLTSGDLKQLPSRILGRRTSKIEIFAEQGRRSFPIASGSYEVDSMLVIPCSMGTLAAIARGSDDLIARAATSCLKKGASWCCAFGDTRSIDSVENMLRAQQAGAVIMPVIPAFYDSRKR